MHGSGESKCCAPKHLRSQFFQVWTVGGNSGCTPWEGCFCTNGHKAAFCYNPSRPSPSEKPPTRNCCITEHARTEEGEGLVSRLEFSTPSAKKSKRAGNFCWRQSVVQYNAEGSRLYRSIAHIPDSLTLSNTSGRTK